jgi:hypothetical protein
MECMGWWVRTTDLTASYVQRAQLRTGHILWVTKQQRMRQRIYGLVGKNRGCCGPYVQRAQLRTGHILRVIQQQRMRQRKFELLGKDN